jgi:hypothetical protein
MEEGEFRMALENFQECYVIRKKLYNDVKHPEFVRISLLIVHLFNSVKIAVENPENPKKMKTMLSTLQEHICNTVFDKDLDKLMQ